MLKGNPERMAENLHRLRRSNLTYSPVDRKPGLSLQDISLSFYGSRGGTKLEKSVDGSMRQYFTSDADYKAVKGRSRAW